MAGLYEKNEWHFIGRNSFDVWVVWCSEICCAYQRGGVRTVCIQDVRCLQWCILSFQFWLSATFCSCPVWCLTFLEVGCISLADTGSTSSAAFSWWQKMVDPRGTWGFLLKHFWLHAVITTQNVQPLSIYRFLKVQDCCQLQSGHICSLLDYAVAQIF